jgi:hypothetical protein
MFFLLIICLYYLSAPKHMGVFVPREKSLDETPGRFLTQINTPGTARRNQDNKPLFRKDYNDLEAIRMESSGDSIPNDLLAIGIGVLFSIPGTVYLTHFSHR